MKEKNAILGTVVLLFIGFFFIIDSFNITVFKGMGSTAINSATLPRMWAFLLIALCIYVLVRTLVRMHRESKNNNTSEKGALKSLVKNNFESIFSLVLMALYFGLMKPLGFIPATILYLYGQVMLLQRKEERNFWIPAVLAVVASVLIYYVFRYQLEIVLPQGIMPF